MSDTIIFVPAGHDPILVNLFYSQYEHIPTIMVTMIEPPVLN